MFSKDPQTQKILRQMIQWEKDKRKYNEAAKQEFENTFHEGFAILPTRLTSGRWVWFQTIYTRYEAVKRSYIEFTNAGGWRITDPVAHYMVYTYKRGAPLERRSVKEHFLLSMKKTS